MTIPLSADVAEYLAAIISDSDDAILSKDRDAIITSWNPAAERMYGYTAAEAIGQPISILIPEHRAGEEKQILARILQGERVERYETERCRQDRSLLSVSLTVSPIRYDGEVVGASVIARDVTEQRRSRELSQQLQDVTASLSRSLTAAEVVSTALDQTLAAIEADAGAVGLLNGDEVLLAMVRGHGPDVIEEWRRFPMTVDVPMTRVIESGVPMWETEGDSETLAQSFRDLSESDVRFATTLALPLIAGGTTIGALSFSFKERRRLQILERTFLVSVAQQAAHAIDRSNAYEAERVAAQRQRLVAEAAELLSRYSLNPEATMEALAQLAARHLADWCAVLLGTPGRERDVTVAHPDPATAREIERLISDSAHQVIPSLAGSGLQALRRGRLYETVRLGALTTNVTDPADRALLEQIGIRSAMIVPMPGRHGVLGALAFVSSQDGLYGEADLALAEDLGRRAGMAIENALLFQREHEAAVTLQRSLLPEAPPAMGGIEVAARYEPAGPGTGVGGDWFEVIDAGDGSVAMTIGDVAGRGIEAAAVMGRLRTTLSAYVRDGHGPGAAIERLDRMMRDSGPTRMTTVLHLQYDRGSRRARYVRAGHPPALLRLADGEIVRLSGTGTPPLGVMGEITISENELEIPAGSLLLMYTDGLIERRRSDIVAGIERLERSLAEAPATPAACLDHLSREFTDDSLADDIAMLAVLTAD